MLVDCLWWNGGTDIKTSNIIAITAIAVYRGMVGMQVPPMIVGSHCLAMGLQRRSWTTKKQKWNMEQAIARPTIANR